MRRQSQYLKSKTSGHCRQAHIGIRADLMKIVAALLALIALGSPASAVGFQQVSVPDPGFAPLEIGIWYSSDAPAREQPLALFRQTVAADGAVAGERLPLVILSHGTGGAFSSNYDTALALAQAGYVVAAVTH